MPREPEALYRALVDLRRAMDGRPPATAPLQRPSPRSRGMVIDPSQTGEIARRAPEDTILPGTPLRSRGDHLS